jgi:serine/threonine protein kinase
MVTSNTVDPPFEWKLRDACAQFDRRLRAGESCRVEEYLAKLGINAGEDQSEASLELIYTEYLAREARGEELNPEEWYARFPHWGDSLRRLLEVHDLARTEEIADAQVDTPLVDPTPRDTSVENLTGHRIGQYELLEPIGRGGMGVVYRARQLGLGRFVAVKLIGVDETSREVRARFRAEAEIAAELQHPNIVPIYEVGEQNGFAYFSMELLDGRALDERLAQSPLPPRAAAELVERMARAVHHAHQCQVIHRDLKPANVLLAVTNRPDGISLSDPSGDMRRYELKITDFGLAKQVSPDLDRAAQDGLTRPGVILGTPSYMPPEQAAGDPERVGPATDIYALGAILYEALTSRVPFQGETTLETLEQARSLEPIPPSRLRPKLSADLETICLKCLEKEPNSRYATAVAVAEELRR